MTTAQSVIDFVTGWRSDRNIVGSGPQVAIGGLRTFLFSHQLSPLIHESVSER